MTTPELMMGLFVGAASDSERWPRPLAVARGSDKPIGIFGVVHLVFRGLPMTPFESLVPLLVDAIPRAVASMKLRKPICAVRIYYYDTHAPCTYLLLQTVSADCRANVLASKGRNAPYYLWGSGEACGDGEVELPSKHSSSKTRKQIATLFQKVYDLLCEDEDENMVAFREMLQQVARELNSKDWTTICPVTDDFVVIPADGSVHFGDDYQDIAASVLADRLDLLRSRGFLGPGETWDQLP
jgi:hypothetical protein